MPVDPYIARGVTPIGEGLTNALIAREGMQQDRRRNQLADYELARRYAADQNALTQQSQQSELLEKLGQINAGEKDPSLRAPILAEARAELPQLGQMPDESLWTLLREKTYAAAGYKPEKANEVGGIKIGQYNPGDYTPETWAQFVKSQDPAGLRRQYAPSSPPAVVVRDVAGVPTVVVPDRQGGAIQTPLTTLPKVAGAAGTIAGAKAGATAGVEAQAKVAAQNRELNKTMQTYEAARKGLLSGLGGSRTGPVSGRIPAVTAPQQIAEGAVAAMGPVLKQIFRVAGEGVFTDRDQQLLLDMIPKRTDHPDTIKAKMNNIDAIVKAKLAPPASAVPEAPAADGWSVEEVPQ